MNNSKLQQIITDLQYWITASVKILQFYRSRYLKVPADELYEFITMFDEDVDKTAKYAFTEAEKKIKESYSTLVQEAIDLGEHKANIMAEDPNYQREEQPVVNRVERIEVEEEQPEDDFRQL